MTRIRNLFLIVTIFLLSSLTNQRVLADTTPTFVRSFTSDNVTPFFYPEAVALDASGNLYVADTLNHRIVKLNASGNFVTAWGTEGLGNGQFEYPVGVAVGAGGAVYVSDYQNNRIQKFTAAGVYVSKWGKNGGDGSAGSGDGELNGPMGIATDLAGNVYVADQGNNRIQKFDQNGNFLAKYGSSGSGNGQFAFPTAVAVDAAGSIYVADEYNYLIQKLDSSGVFVRQFGSNGSGDGQFAAASYLGVSVDENGNTYVSDSDLHRVQKFDPSGNFILKFGRNGGDGNFGSGNGEFDLPAGTALDTNGYLYVADVHNARVQKFLVSVASVASTTPTTTAQAASSITATAAILNGTLTDTGSASTTVRGFNYGLTPEMLLTTTESSEAFATGTYAATITNLTCNSLYYFRAYASNAVGTATSSQVTFTTGACPVISGGGGDNDTSGGGTAIIPVKPTAVGGSQLSLVIERVDTIAPDTKRVVVRLNGDTRTVRWYTLATSENLSAASLEKYSDEVFFDIPAYSTRVYGAYYSITGHASPVLFADIVQKTSANTAITPTPKLIFSRTLSFGLVHPDVRLLQKYLNSHGAQVSQKGAGSPGKETNYFGNNTRNALLRFQKMHALAINIKGQRAYVGGVFDMVTRAYIQKNI